MALGANQQQQQQQQGQGLGVRAGLDLGGAGLERQDLLPIQPLNVWSLPEDCPLL
jgi:hypothetical protein